MTATDILERIRAGVPFSFRQWTVTKHPNGGFAVTIAGCAMKRMRAGKLLEILQEHTKPNPCPICGGFLTDYHKTFHVEQRPS